MANTELKMMKQLLVLLNYSRKQKKYIMVSQCGLPNQHVIDSALYSDETQDRVARLFMVQFPTESLTLEAAVLCIPASLTVLDLTADVVAIITLQMLK